MESRDHMPGSYREQGGEEFPEDRMATAEELDVLEDELYDDIDSEEVTRFEEDIFDDGEGVGEPPTPRRRS